MLRFLILTADPLNLHESRRKTAANLLSSTAMPNGGNDISLELSSDLIDIPSESTESPSATASKNVIGVGTCDDDLPVSPAADEDESKQNVPSPSSDQLSAFVTAIPPSNTLLNPASAQEADQYSQQQKQQQQQQQQHSNSALSAANVAVPVDEALPRITVASEDPAPTLDNMTKPKFLSLEQADGAHSDEEAGNQFVFFCSSTVTSLQLTDSASS